jgi:murein DD-endopeptidase MepM/ murein hydrolase activator NlpD
MRDAERFPEVSSFDCAERKDALLRSGCFLAPNLKRTPILLLVVLVLGLHLTGDARAQNQDSFEFSPPLGYRDGLTYEPRQMQDSDGKLIEDTDYGVMNPDLRGNTCFGIAWEKIYHAGQDLYRADGKSTAGAEVTAAADGKVIYANPDLNYPGLVVIIEHTPPGDDRLYSVYAHLDDNSLAVEEGETVERGQALGTVMYQAYTGRFPEHHPSDDDSHLHFEVRRFYNARNIYKNAPACNGLVAGRGYTHPQKPDDFPESGAGYVDPETVVSAAGS